MRQDEYWDDVGVTLNRKDPHQYALAPASYFAAEELSERSVAVEQPAPAPAEAAPTSEPTPTRSRVGTERRFSPVSDRQMRATLEPEAGGAGEVPMSLQQVPRAVLYPAPAPPFAPSHACASRPLRLAARPRRIPLRTTPYATEPTWLGRRWACGGGSR